MASSSGMIASSSRSINTCSNEFCGRSMAVPLPGWKSGDRQVDLCYQCFDLSLGIPFPSDLSLGNVRWGMLDRDTFPSDNPQRKGGSHIFFSQEISATVAHIPRRHVAGEGPI
ncbi:hypothetical protein Tco_1196463 [Tanacetum coccineum]